MQNFKKCIIGHAGSRDSYQLGLAFYEANLLDVLVTDFFLPDFIYRFTKRPASGIPFVKSKMNKVAFWEFMKLKLPFLPTPNDSIKKDAAISKTCLNIAVNNSTNLFLYSYYAYDAFQFLTDNNYPNKRILFQVHPHPLSIRRILKEDIERLPYTRTSIENESEFLIKPEELEKLCQEIHLSDNCLVASTFTKNTLVENGADPNNISIVPYGVNIGNFPQKKSRLKKADEPFNIIFIGSMIQRKGLADLLLAVKLLKSKKVTITLVGYRMDKNLLSHFSDTEISIRFHATHQTLIQEMHNADVFVLPSLAEGFAHVILEAMSTGLPVITTCNTAGPDLLEDGKEGFIVPIRSPEAIAEKLEILLNRRELCEQMGQAAALKARELSWKKFRNEVISYYKSIN